MLIVNAISHDRGWSPIQHMVSLAAELFDCEVVSGSKPSRASELLSMVRRRAPSPTSDETCLVVCRGPFDMLTALSISDWRKRYRHLVAWVIDSFWLDYIPKSIRVGKPFDHLFVTSLEDVENWKSITGTPTTWLPWGSDVLRLGHGGPDRDWDLMRVGRQPPEWDNDGDAAAAAKALGIKYRGRPDSGDLNSLQNQQLMMRAYGSTKYLLAFSNAVNRDANNHPTREYLTGRWVDALSSGAIVAGIAPQGPGIREVLWPGATLDLGNIHREEGLKVVASALSRWRPDAAAANYRMALAQLDWRWRFKTLSNVCGINSERLNLELNLLKERIHDLEGSELLKTT